MLTVAHARLLPTLRLLVTSEDCTVRVYADTSDGTTWALANRLVGHSNVVNTAAFRCGARICIYTYIRFHLIC